MTKTEEQTCPFCGRDAASPFYRFTPEGKILYRCVGIVHDASIVKPSEAWSFVKKARKTGITGKWS